MIRRVVVARMGEVGRMNVEAFTSELEDQDMGLEERMLTAPVYGIVA